MRPEAVELARFVAIRSSVARVADLLRPHGIPVAPLKGALLVVGIAREPGPRVVGDVDLLVPTGRFPDACAALVDAGAKETVPDTEGRAFTCTLPGAPFIVDLQHRLCRRGLYRLDEAAMLSRGHVDDDAFGSRVVLLSAEDAFAHAIAHHAGGRPLGPADRLAGDLELLGSMIESKTVAERLRADGLVRAFAFVRHDLARRHRAPIRLDEIASQVGATRLDEEFARAALRLVGPDLPKEVDSFARHLTNESATAGLGSATRHLVSSAAHRLRERLRR